MAFSLLWAQEIGKAEARKRTRKTSDEEEEVRDKD